MQDLTESETKIKSINQSIKKGENNMAGENDVVKLDDKVAAKLDAILAGLNMLKDSGVDWKSVFISVGLNVVLLTGFYFFKIRDLATREYVDQELHEHQYLSTEIHSTFYRKIDKLEVDVKKLKEHRIGSVGRVGDEGPK